MVLNAVSLLITLVIFFIIYNTYKYNNIERFTDKPKILFLMRNYNRPEYLGPTLRSLDNSDVEMCPTRIIYDDASTNPETKKILDSYDSKYQILRNSKNYKQKSMVRLLDYVEKSDLDYQYVCYLDNDALVKPNFIEKCMETYQFILKEQNLDVSKVILTGFNTKQNGHDVLKDYGRYKLKKHIGGIHMFFHKSLVPDIKKWWDIDLDWGVVDNFKKSGGNFYCTSPSVVQHIGATGDHTTGGGHDVGKDF